jgi:hypothetical protein
VLLTLMEFGRHRGLAATSSPEADADLTPLASHSDDTAKLSARTVTQLVSVQSGELQKAAGQYSLLREKVGFILLYSEASFFNMSFPLGVNFGPFVHPYGQKMVLTPGDQLYPQYESLAPRVISKKT